MKKLLHWIGTFGSDPWKVAQMAHLGWGYGLSFTGGLICRALHWPWWLTGVLIMGVYVLPKELWLDPKEEKAPFFWDGVYDCGFWLLGIALGIVGGKYL